MIAQDIARSDIAANKIFLEKANMILSNWAIIPAFTAGIGLHTLIVKRILFTFPIIGMYRLISAKSECRVDRAKARFNAAYARYKPGKLITRKGE